MLPYHLNRIPVAMSSRLTQVEEQRLTQAQSAAAEVPLISSGKKKKKGKQNAGTPLPIRNGEGDSLSTNSGVLLVTSAKVPSADPRAHISRDVWNVPWTMTMTWGSMLNQFLYRQLPGSIAG